MRLISQDKEHDIPYESTELLIKDSNIYAFANGNENFVKMASYSTKEKSLKVLGELRYAYITSLIGLDSVESPKNEIIRRKSLDGTMIVHIELAYTGAGYFRFPTEEEITMKEEEDNAVD